MKTTSFNKQNLPEIRAALNKALQQVCADFDLTINIGNIRFTDTEFSTKMTVQTKTNAENKLNTLLNSTAIGIGTKFKFRSSKFEIVRLSPRKTKYQWIARNQNGTEYGFTTECVLKNLL